MACTFDDLAQIITTIENLLFMSDPQFLINISTGYNKRIYCGSEDAKILFTKINFPLKNSRSEIMLSNDYGILFYLDLSGEKLKDIKFDYDDLSLINSTFQQALRQILAFDEQHINQVQIVKASEKIEMSDDLLESVKSPLDEIRKIITE